jgi:protein TonB
MFEQTFIPQPTHDKKPFSVLFSLLLQVATLSALVIAPLIHTLALPQARLRSFFVAPAPPPPALPKAPIANVSKTPARPFFRLPSPVDLLPTSTRSSEPAMTTIAPDLPAGLPVGDSSLPIGVPDGTYMKPPAPKAAAVTQPPVHKMIRMAHIEASQLIHKVQPAYPIIAKQTHVQGTVVFTAVISKAGTIENLQLVSGHPLLVAAAREAILQWRYKPTLLSGEPVEVMTNITVNFTLNE